MKKFLFTSILIFTLFFVQAQDQKWSIEANYPVMLNDNNINNSSAAIDIGLKYRLVNIPLVNLGIGINSGFIFDKSNDSSLDYKNNTYIIQPQVFGEFKLPFAPKLHPLVGMGYSIVSQNVSGDFGSGDFTYSSGADGGFNINLGATYDITKSFFVNANYDYINLLVKDDYEDANGQVMSFENKIKLDRLKIGVGFRL